MGTTSLCDNPAIQFDPVHVKLTHCRIVSREILLTSSAVILSAFMGACEDHGAGVGGAGYDSRSKRRAVEDYPSTVASEIRETTGVPPKNFSPKQHFDDIMRTFPVNRMRVDEKSSQVYGTRFFAQYKRNRFTLRDDGRLIVDQELPAVFNMHPVRLGIGTLRGGRSVLMIVNKSRATTGRYFVGIWGLDGKVLYRRILRVSEVWDIGADGKVINIIGAKRTIRVTLSEED